MMDPLMRTDEAASDVVKSVEFSFYTAEEIRQISVKKITKHDLFDAKNIPVPDGLYDPALGPLNETDSCKSCCQLSVRCPGHCGHIELERPIYHPLLFNYLKSLLQVTCLYCHRFRAKREKVQLYTLQLERLIRGDVVGAKKLQSLIHKESFSQNEVKVSSARKKSVSKEKWTSLQYSEAMSVLDTFMREKFKKCHSCGVKNPKISSPLFGWLNEDHNDADIRANVIQGYNLSLSSMGENTYDEYGDKEQNVEDMKSKEDGGSLTDEELLVHVKKPQRKRHLKDLSSEVIEQLSSSGKTHLLPSKVEVILRDLWKNEPLCMLICDMQHNLSPSREDNFYAMFLLKVLLVPPNKFRPPAGAGSRGVLEHPQNTLLCDVQQANLALSKIIAADANHPDIVPKWIDLQKKVNRLYDSSKATGKSDKNITGLRQVLEKKEGILRQKMMGKRVNYACRSVISPDPFLAVNEIGIPPYFAKRLTYPERVTPWNVNKLRAAIINGPDIHPGSTNYKDKDRIYKLQPNRNIRNAISRRLPTSRSVLTQTTKGPETEFEGKVVYRHLKDGDIVLVNRQPTLHKPSMMAHVVRVLKGEKTIRMHYANCSTYNADFDGDEMNVHLPQDEVSRAEAIHIVNANRQFVVPSSGDPIRGLIQDHIISAVLLTMKDTFLTREEYQQLLYASCVPTFSTNPLAKGGRKSSVVCGSDDIQPLPPAIQKPILLWTGKQVISAILCHITRDHQPFIMEKDGRIPKEYFGKDLSERILHIHNNELIHGIIDKAQFGKYGIVHVVHELYGADTAGTLMSMFSRLFTLFLQMHGFTCGVDDLLIDQDTDLKRKKILDKSEIRSLEAHVRFTADTCSKPDRLQLQRETEKVIRTNGELATTRLDRMMSSALNQITSEVNSVLFPYGLVKPFPSNCLSLMTTTGAKGGSVNMTQISSLLGQQELEGKRVPRMISGKTLPCFPPWDISSRAGGFISDRFLTGLRPQEYFFHCMAGRDGLVDTAIKTSRSGYLQRCLVKNLESLKVCYDFTVRDADGSVVQFMYGEDGVDVHKTSFLAEFKVLSTNQRVFEERFSSHLEDAHLFKSNDFIKELPDALKEEATNYVRRLSKSSRYTTHPLNRKDFMKLMKVKYFSSLVEPGEAVGILAAQSVGEPSTQMTLNTFHFAGRGEMNVTLGIPRLQEILMSAKEDIRTPVMTCPLLSGTSREDAEHVAAKLRRVTVADIIENMEVSTFPCSLRKGELLTNYKLKLKLYPPELYPPHSNLTSKDFEKILCGEYVDELESAGNKHVKAIRKINDISIASRTQESSLLESADEDNTKSKGTKGVDDAVVDNDEDENAEDQGTDAEKRKRQINDEMEYDDDIEKERTSKAHEHDGELQSGFESEVDQVEPEEDYTMGGNDLDSHEQDGTLGSLSNPESAEDIIEEQTQEPKKKKKKTKKDDPLEVVNPHFERLRFEVDVILIGGPHILLAEIALRTAKKVFVKKSDKIERCSVVEPKKDTDPLMLQTAGVNFPTFWQFLEYLDVNKIVTNDVHAMLRTYGVEAARATIIKEVNAVFEAYGIRVNTRHLSLIADFMTCHGGYRPMNRLGMERFTTSPFGKMTFETASKFMVEAAIHGEVDTLESPSASICLGQPPKMGTGSFDLMQNIQL